MSNANFLALLASELQHDITSPSPTTAIPSPPQMNKFKRYFGKDRLPLPRPSTRIRLQNDLVVVHPRSTPLPLDSLDDPSSNVELSEPDDTLLFGHATITAEPYIDIHSVRVGLVVVYRYKQPTDERLCESIIFEQYKSFSPDEIQLTTNETSRQIHRRVNFDILVPASLPTYEHSAHGIILPQVRVMVEYGYSPLSKDTIESITANPPSAIEEKEETSVILGRKMITDIWQGGGTVYVPKKSYAITTITNDSDTSIDTASERRVQTWVKNMAVIANSNPTAGTHSLRVHKTGLAPGIGEWHVYLFSDSFSVGGYVIPRLELTSLAPGSTIYAIHLQLHQTFHITPPEEYRFNPSGQEQYNPSETRCTPEKIPIFQDGTIPMERKPRKGTRALWTGPKKGEMKDSVGAFVWQQQKLRIPDESKTRPSTVVGTSTLMRVQHDVSLRIFFSIDGETIGGQPIRDRDQAGEMRMLVLSIPCFLASCCCISERIILPEYSEKKTNGSEPPGVPMCACCYKTEDFPEPVISPEYMGRKARKEEGDFKVANLRNQNRLNHATRRKGVQVNPVATLQINRFTPAFKYPRCKRKQTSLLESTEKLDYLTDAWPHHFRFNFKHLTGALNSSLNSVDVSGLTKNFKSTVQSTRERLGQVDPSEVTELPAEYKALENRVDALYNVHKGLLRIVKVHESESYDYPTQLTESVGELSHDIARGWASFANNNLKNANLPFPIAPATPATNQPTPPKTLPHALSRAAREGALHVGTEERLGKALDTYATAMEKVGDARLQQDDIIVDKFITPWQATLSTSLALANKARANVKNARLELDTARAALKTAGPKTQEQARLQVEEAEDKLVQMTETAIGLMKAVLENPEPIQNLSSLVKAQLIYFSTAAETLSSIQGEIEEAAVAAESEYRQSRAA
ncbi:hypothetical protein QFC22_004746 [Naganishia vaughanmartiniae]|uniref:Uncharacterized protein n=1 Tax=Naganishia vaughanmartiniae TaxID=1424756 RepID=A0ACC2WZS1_9TREE|nr:hypothetical protein QFC22_004746 [Naganishia vaughanmartiniae]